MKEHEMLEKVFSYMEEYHMLMAGDTVVTGVSGGADSVCLLFVMLEYAKRVPIRIAVVHINHKIRPEAVADAAFVEALCREAGVPFYLIESDVAGRARAEGLSEEEAGRKVRYEAFARVAKTLGEEGDMRVRIAVAHHMGDRAETFLFHLFRGSGLKGLGSIRPVREQIIRPLLCLERGEIEAYLAQIGQTYCTDATNAQDSYARNRIRHHILPYAEAEICRGAAAHICQSAQLLAETEAYLSLQTKEALAHCVVLSDPPAQKAVIEVARFAALHPLLQKRVLYEALCRLALGAKDITAVHVEQVRGLFDAQSGKEASLPFGLCARREFDAVILQRRIVKETQEALPEQTLPEQKLLRTGSCRIAFLGEEYAFSLLGRADFVQKIGNIPQKQYTKWFDYDKIKGLPVLRTRRAGDFFCFRRGEGSFGTKRLKDYLIAQRIPKQEREQVALLAVDSHVIWIVGYRISEAFKVDEGTRRILQVQVIGKAEG